VQCRYCGRPAGFRKNMHPECRERHQRALAHIPDFFPKFYQSDLSVERFSELLRNAAEASFVRPRQLTELADRGFSHVVQQLLDQRFPTEPDMQRLHDLAQALAPILTRDIVPHETFAKIEVLQELANAKVPDVVSVAGPMPLELGEGETVIWIFNYVSSIGDAADAKPAALPSEVAPIPLSLEPGSYHAPSTFKSVAIPEQSIPQDDKGDMVVTNQSLIFINSTVQARRIPVTRITGIGGYANAIHVACDETVAERVQTFSLDDPWFAANMIVRLVHLVGHR
jgi:hypothetical protein